MKREIVISKIENFEKNLMISLKKALVNRPQVRAKISVPIPNSSITCSSRWPESGWVVRSSLVAVVPSSASFQITKGKMMIKLHSFGKNGYLMIINR